MKLISNTAYVFCFCWNIVLSIASAKDFSDEVERDYSLRSIVKLQVTNAKGDVTVHGWAHDKIRIKMKRQVSADTPEKAKALLEALEFRYFASRDRIEISNQYGGSMSIEERLQEKGNQKSRVDLVIYAPSKLKLMVWTVDGKINLTSWNERVETRSNEGSIQVEGLKGDHFSLLCSSCSAFLRNIRSNVKCFGKSGFIHLDTVSGKNIFVETESGTLRLSHIEGEQLYLSQSGEMSGQFLKGKIQFHTQSASVDFREVSGYLAGSSEAGSVFATFKEWKPNDDVLIESTKGNISLTMPRQFTSDVDIWSVQGKTLIDFPLQKFQDPATIGPEPANHLIGRVREGGDLLKVFSEYGDISISKR